MKIISKVIAKSIRDSCAIDQTPFSIKIGIFVVVIAVIMIIKSGIAAILVEKPIIMNAPQAISKEATKYARNSGLAKPIFSNRPAPNKSGKRNFCASGARN